MKKEIDFVNTLSFVLLASSLMSIVGFILMYMDKRRAKKIIGELRKAHYL